MTVSDAERAAERDYEQAARLNLAVSLQAEKRDGAEMAEAVAVCTPTMTDLDTGAMNVDPDPDATQLVTESACRKRKEDDSEECDKRCCDQTSRKCSIRGRFLKRNGRIKWFSWNQDHSRALLPQVSTVFG